MTSSVSKFKDPPTIIALLGLVVTLIGLISDHYILRSERLKELQPILLANTSLITIDKSIQPNIEVRYKGKEVKNLSLVQVQLENSGNLEIRVGDYENNPIKFKFPDSAEIVGAVVLKTNPNDMKQEAESRLITNPLNISKLSPILFNKGNWIVFEFLVANMPESNQDPVTITASIAGVEIKPLNSTGWHKPDRNPVLGWFNKNRFLLPFLSLLIFLIYRIYLISKKSP
jgi:hypothetical protein